MNWLAFASIISAALAVSFGAIGPALGEGRAAVSYTHLKLSMKQVDQETGEDISKREMAE